MVREIFVAAAVGVVVGAEDGACVGSAIKTGALLGAADGLEVGAATEGSAVGRINFDCWLSSGRKSGGGVGLWLDEMVRDSDASHVADGCDHFV